MELFPKLFLQDLFNTWRRKHYVILPLEQFKVNFSFPTGLPTPHTYEIASLDGIFLRRKRT